MNQLIQRFAAVGLALAVALVGTTRDAGRRPEGRRQGPGFLAARDRRQDLLARSVQRQESDRDRLRFPKADTPGCTAECKSLKESGDALKPLNVAYFTGQRRYPRGQQEVCREAGGGGWITRS